MNRKLLKKITWGFEIEGLFRNDLVRDLIDIEKEKKEVRVEFKYDGSVDIESLPDNLTTEKWAPYTEITVGVFKSFEKMIKVLSMFKNGENYLENETCGLYVHLGTENKLLKVKIGDYRFIKNLQKWVSDNFCKRTSDRLKNQYCMHYTSFDTTYNRWRDGRKYYFIRNHDQGTFEFRFFAPCEHKKENLKKFFEYFFNELKKLKPKKQKMILLPETEEQRIELQFNIEKNF